MPYQTLIVLSFNVFDKWAIALPFNRRVMALVRRESIQKNAIVNQVILRVGHQMAR
ncbi:MAG: hypothetical protein ACJ70V_06795 [Nitrososphaera sp.]